MNSLKMLLRFVIIGALLLLLLIPLALISGIIDSRTSYRGEAVNRVSQSYANQQLLIGPVRVLPWTEEQKYNVQEKDGQIITKTNIITGYELHMPSRLRVKGELIPDQRLVGLFKVPVYRLSLRLQAEFAEADYPAKEGRHYKQPYVALGIKDVRGLVGTPVIKIDGEESLPRASAGILDEYSTSGLNLPLPMLENEQHGTLSSAKTLELELELNGTRELAVVPLADDTQIDLSSSWPHPSFRGSFLPNERHINDDGFSARWAISSLASQAQTQLQNCLTTGCNNNSYVSSRSFDNSVESLGVQLIEPIDIYSQTKRATKYGILFVLLTFVGFVLFELVKRLRIHPLQYLMVGMALALFFLLLLSLSEYMLFWQAYVIAASSCIGLQGVYLSGVLRNSRQGIAFSAILSVLYAVLYVILRSENNALLMGTLLLFGILAAIMMSTRKIDWYNTDFGKR